MTTSEPDSAGAAGGSPRRSLQRQPAQATATANRMPAIATVGRAALRTAGDQRERASAPGRPIWERTAGAHRGGAVPREAFRRVARRPGTRIPGGVSVWTYWGVRAWSPSARRISTTHWTRTSSVTNVSGQSFSISSAFGTTRPGWLAR